MPTQLVWLVVRSSYGLCFHFFSCNASVMLTVFFSVVTSYYSLLPLFHSLSVRQSLFFHRIFRLSMEQFLPPRHLLLIDSFLLFTLHSLPAVPITTNVCSAFCSKTFLHPPCTFIYHCVLSGQHSSVQTSFQISVYLSMRNFVTTLQANHLTLIIAPWMSWSFVPRSICFFWYWVLLTFFS